MTAYGITFATTAALGHALSITFLVFPVDSLSSIASTTTRITFSVSPTIISTPVALCKGVFPTTAATISSVATTTSTIGTVSDLIRPLSGTDLRQPLPNLHVPQMNLALGMPETSARGVPTLHAGTAHITHILSAQGASFFLPVEDPPFHFLGKLQSSLGLLVAPILREGLCLGEERLRLFVQAGDLCLGHVVRASLLDLLVRCLDVPPRARNPLIRVTNEIL
mmetsp:Transcript_62150/g.165023  ORF Transcript_62150/g.165023 Transcript_62150/m.165023 type:complete len:223 (-) Transcript_62150:348-1016(-)